MLDTFDGRLHRAGLRLEACEADGVELVLSGDETVTAHLATRSAPRFPADLPHGPLRDRIAAILEMRALIPKLRLTAIRTAATWTSPFGSIVATATIHEHVHIVDPDQFDLPTPMIEIHQVGADDAPARRAIEVLDRLGFHRVPGDVLTEAVTVAGIELAGFSASVTVPLDPTMPAIDGFRAVLVNLADTIVANRQGTIDELDPEFLHALRVAVRRTRSILAHGKNVIPVAIDRWARDGFGWLGNLTGPARDLDVYLIEWHRYTGPLGPDIVAALAPTRALLERRHREASAMVAEGLRSSTFDDLLVTWLAWLRHQDDDGPRGSKADRPLGRVVARRIVRAQATLVDRGRWIRPATPVDHLHRLRKDAKKLRYLLECFGTLMPGDRRTTFVRSLKALQDNLGELQDAEVHGALLRAISLDLLADGASADTMHAIGQLTERLDRRRHEARVEFASRFATYDTRGTQRTLDAMLDGIER